MAETLDLQTLQQKRTNAEAAGDAAAVARYDARIAALQQLPTEEPVDESRMATVAKALRSGFGGEPGAGEVFGHNATLGLQRPLTGAMEGVRSWMGGEGFTPGYRAGEAAYDEYLNEAREKSGWGGTAAGVAGSLVSGAPRAVAGVPSLLRSARDAAVLSGVQGTAEAEGTLPERLVEGGKAAAVGGATGAAIHGATQMPGFRARRAAARAEARGTPPDQLRDEARGFYDQLDQAGVAYDGQQAQDLHHDILANIGGAGYNPRIHRDTSAVLDDLAEATAGPMSLNRLQQVREQAREAASGVDPKERRMAGRVIDEIDRFVASMDPPTGTMASGEVASTWQNARRLWRAANVAEDVLWKVSKAERRAASTASGGNTENTLRQNIRGMIDKAEQPGRANPYTPDEIAQMNRVVEGTPTQNALRSVGNTFGGSGPLGIAPGAGVGGFGMAAGLDPVLSAALSAGSLVLGKGARAASSQMAENQVDELVRLITQQGGPTNARAAMQGPPTREQLAEVMRQAALSGKLPLAWEGLQ